MKSCAICGSHAFNMATEGVNQGGFCDRHYWQRKAEALEAARATPALPQVSEYNHAKCPGHDAYAASQALPQGAEEWIDMHSVGASLFDREVLCVAACDLRAYLSGMAIVPVELTDEMLVAARDWSYKKYGQPIGNDAAKGCWQAMLTAAKEKQS